MLRITKEFVYLLKTFLLCFDATTGLFVWPFELEKLEQSTRATRKKRKTEPKGNTNQGKGTKMSKR